MDDKEKVNMVADSLNTITEPVGKDILLKQVELVQAQVKLIKEDDVEALKAVEMFLTIVHIYDSWLFAYQKEMKKMYDTIQAQNETLNKVFRDKKPKSKILKPTGIQ